MNIRSRLSRLLATHPSLGARNQARSRAKLRSAARAAVEHLEPRQMLTQTVFFPTFSSPNNEITFQESTPDNLWYAERHDDTLSGDPTAATGGPQVTFSYTVGGTAVPGVDYTAMPGTATIQQGWQNNVDYIHLINNNHPDPDRTIVLTLVGGSGYTVGTPSTVTIHIADDDGGTAQPPPTSVNNGTTTNAPDVNGKPKAEQRCPTNVSGGPVRYGDGLVEEHATDLAPASALPWGHSRSWTNSDAYAGEAQNGNGWVVDQWPSLAKSADGNSVAYIIDGNEAQWFDGTTTFNARHDALDTLALSNGEYVLTLQDGSQYRFYDFGTSLPADQRGSFKSYRDAAGNEVTAYGHDAAGNLTDVRQAVAGTSTVDSYLYEYFASGANAGRLQRVTYRTSADGGTTFTTARQAEYAYYDGSLTGENAFGNLGDLKTATVEDAAGNAIDTTFYRYYTGGESTGYKGGMKYALYAADYGRATAALGNPLTATDAQIAAYASRYYEYDAQHRVSRETVSAAGCSTCSGGFGTYQFSYASSANADGYNSWKYKTTETLPDGNQNVVYMNYLQQVMLKVFRNTATGQEWCTYTQYDNAGRVVMMAEPSAVSGYWEASPDLLTDPAAAADAELEGLRDDQGLITRTAYGASNTATASTAGDALGYVKSVSLADGELATPVKQEERTYVQRVGSSGTTYVLAADTVFRNDDGTGAQTTSYAYTWQGGTTRPASVTKTLPTVTTAENGPGTATGEVTVFDAYGRPVWERDADGFISYAEYDPGTGAVTKQIADVDTAAVANAPAGWATPAGGGLHLVTQYQDDALGRTTRAVDPKGNVTYTLYNDAAHEVRTYQGWTQTGSTWGPTGPVLVSRDDRAGSYNETLTFSYRSTASATPTGAEAITASNIQSLTRKYQNNAGQLDHTDSYFSLAGQTYTTGTNLGTLGTNFLQTSYAYQGRGQLKRIVLQNGTIRWTVYDGLNRILSEWTGTNDTGFTNSDPSGGGAAGNNMVKIAEYAYDGGGIGDSNLTQSRAVFGSGASDYYAADYQYDWRDRLTDSRGADKVATHATLDNLGEATQVDTYADADADFVIDAGELRGRAQAAYDERGQVYQSKVFNVDPVTGNVTPGSGQNGHALTTNTWYNGRGTAVKVSQPNGLFQKTSYDGAGRLTATYTGYDADDTEGGSAYAGAQTVTGDTVIAQAKTIYDRAGNAVTNTSYDRLESDTTSTGALGAATNQAFVQTSVSWYDAADRLVGTANYGRDNGGTRYVFNTAGGLIDADADGVPDEAGNAPRLPNTSDDYIAAKYEYDAAGRLYQTTDNLGHVTRTGFDLLGRKTSLVENYVDGVAAETETATDRTTEWVYDAQGRLSKLRAKNPKGGGAGVENQDTTYLYESPFDGSLVTSTIYPDSADTTSAGTDQVKVSYDRLGRRVSTTDQLGTVHAYEYDSAGRFLADNVATLGAGVDGAVRRIEYAYDDRSGVRSVTSRSGTTAASAAVNQVAYAYDGWGNVTKTQQAHTGVVTSSTPAVQYTFDDGLASGSTNTAALYLRQTQVTYPAGRQVFYNYGSSATPGTSATNSWYLNRVDAVADSAAPAAAGTYAQYTYVGADRIIKVEHPATGTSASNRVTLAYSLGTAGQYAGLDRFGRVVQQLWKDANLSGGNFDGYQYTYDRDGNILSKDYYASGNANTLDEQFTYDGLDRLASYKRGTLSGGAITGTNVKYSQDWTGGLDALGNWKSYVNNGTTQTRTHDKANETTGIAGQSWIAPSYDAAGNMTSAPKAGSEGTRLWYVYDAWGRLVQVNNDSSGSPGTVLATYAYDGLNRRVSKSTGGNTDDFYYNEGWQLLETRRNGSSNAREQYAWDASYIDTPIFRVQDTDSNGTVDNTIYYLTDVNHNVTSVYDAATSNVQERYVYDPYGKVTIYDRAWGAVRASSSYGNNVLFGGYFYDAETGNSYVRNRYYNPSLGTWQQRDSAGYIDGENLYQFVLSNPGNFFDPSGLGAEWNHDVPKAVLTPGVLEQLGVPDFDVHAAENGTIMDAVDHRTGPNAIHRGAGRGGDYNAAWQRQVNEWLKSGTKITAEDIQKFREQLRNDPRFKPSFDKGKPAKERYPGAPKANKKVLGALAGIAALIATGEQSIAVTGAFAENGTSANEWFKSAIDPKNCDCDSLAYGTAFKNMKEQIIAKFRSGTGYEGAATIQALDAALDALGNYARDACLDRRRAPK